MADQKWSDVGNSISNMVQEAIDAQDFSKLSDAIQDTVSMVESMTKRQGFIPKAQNPWKGNDKSEHKTERYVMHKDVPGTSLYSVGGGSTFGGYLLTIAGGAGTFGLGMAELILGTVALSTGANLQIPMTILFAPLIVSVFMLIRGRASLGRISRFRNYVRVLGNRTCITLKELASGTGKGEAFVLKDVRDMLNRGMFRQGRLDEKEKSLFVTNQSYEAYIDDKKKAEAQRAAEETRAGEKADYRMKDTLSDEVKKTIAEGQGYIDKIHAANKVIQDAEVSRKLDALEATVANIFEYVEAHPQSASETKKLMKYYLPTTIKLLDSYQQLDDHPIQGENISNSRKQIENTLDTLNQAFARLFDNLYQDTSMDINSDISVLNTMLAQEGLTGNKM
ncbi:MAG: 5-bromo-4-chloroindolyl phosphate hydrolysis family protein [Eubacteriales bacterium]|nr:5-bromo-4-chloroindolyl phosphate hydrolysis family protein [Eubacteriales bacterium]